MVRQTAPADRIRDLRGLCRLYGVQTSYVDGLNRRRYPPREALLALLAALGAYVNGPQSIKDAYVRSEMEAQTRCLESVTVSWQGDVPEVLIRAPAQTRRAMERLTLTDEGGASRTIDWSADRHSVERSYSVDGKTYDEYRLRLGRELPNGYYHVETELPGSQASGTLIRAPTQAADLDRSHAGRQWGVFLPTYAIRTERSTGMGDFSDLGELMAAAGRWNAEAVATLPLLPAFIGDPSPYSAVSRLFWNELFVDPSAAPEFVQCAPARDMFESRAFQAEVADLRRDRHVNYERQWRLRRPLLEHLARHAYQMPDLRHEIERYARDNPESVMYAKFRAACERLGRPWSGWKESPRAGRISVSDYEEDVFRLFLNTQRLAADQIAGQHSNKDRAGLFLDMPLGVRGDGFDAWRWPQLFAQGVNAGAPPDDFFVRGQDWGFAPVLPAMASESAYDYLRKSLSHVMRHADILRIDHVMGLHRLFWIPSEMSAAQGTYVRYPAEELYAVIALESQRHGTVVVGEDLGTVPTYVGPMMRKHRFHRMYATYFAIDTMKRPPLRPPARDMFAVVNTHDMPTFSAFAKGLDVAGQEELGLLDNQSASARRSERRRAIQAVRRFLATNGAPSGDDPTDIPTLYRRLVAYLMRSNAAFVLLNLEDLWGEEEPQNTPGTTSERENWKLNARLFVDQVSDLMKEFLADMKPEDSARGVRLAPAGRRLG